MSKKNTKNPVKKQSKKPPQKRGRGRPPMEYLDADSVQKILHAFSMDATVEEACSVAGISTSTHYNWIEQKRIFLDKIPTMLGKVVVDYKEIPTEYGAAVQKAENMTKILARQAVYNALQRGDEKTGMEVLKRRDPRYRDKQETGTPQDFIDLDEVEHGA